MLTLANAELTVSLIDPAAEQARLGPRYCWGGYIWQVSDRSIGTLLTGPEWPELTPLPHNGQGLPESFRHSTTEGAPLLWDGAVGLARLRQRRQGQRRVRRRPCRQSQCRRQSLIRRRLQRHRPQCR